MYIIVLIILNIIVTKVAVKIAHRRFVLQDEVTTDASKREEPKKKLSSYIKNSVSAYMHGFIRYKLRLVGQIPSHRLRKTILKNIYDMKIDKNVVLYGGFEIRAPWNITIGEGSIIGDESKLDGRNGIIIGKNVNFSTGVWIWTEQHDMNDPYFRCLKKGGQVIIEDRVWISARTIILPNIKIREGAVIAAGAVLTKNVEPYSIYAGIPAKKIAERERNIAYDFDGGHLHFF